MTMFSRVDSHRLLAAIFVAAALLTPQTAVAAEPSLQPVRLTIPAIGVDAHVVPVGLTPDRRMDAPRDRSTVGWYQLGVAPGNAGNAVMAGHLDTASGEPAVFWSLSKLPVGSEILVTAADGSVKRFRTSGMVSYLTDETPMHEVFGATSTTRLNLITCAGRWDTQAGRYDHRLVVYADFAGAAGAAALPAPAMDANQTEATTPNDAREAATNPSVSSPPAAHGPSSAPRAQPHPARRHGTHL